MNKNVSTTTMQASFLSLSVTTVFVLIYNRFSQDVLSSVHIIKFKCICRTFIFCKKIFLNHIYKIHRPLIIC